MTAQTGLVKFSVVPLALPALRSAPPGITISSPHSWLVFTINKHRHLETSPQSTLHTSDTMRGWYRSLVSTLTPRLSCSTHINIFSPWQVVWPDYNYKTLTPPPAPPVCYWLSHHDLNAHDLKSMYSSPDRQGTEHCFHLRPEPPRPDLPRAFVSQI